MEIAKQDVELLELMIKAVAPEDTGNLKKWGFSKITITPDAYFFEVGNAKVPYAGHIKKKGTHGKVPNEWYIQVAIQWCKLMEVKYNDVRRIS